MKVIGSVLAAALLFSSAPLAAQVDVDRYVKKDAFDQIKLSPSGDYYAASVPMEKQTVLVIMRRPDNKLTATFSLGKNTHVMGFWWVNPERVVISAGEKLGELESPLSTGELYAINANGGKVEFLVGQRVAGEGLGTRIQPKKVEMIAAEMIDDLPNDDKNILISVSPFNADAFTRVERMDVYSGRRTPVARAPVRNASFTTDNGGVVRFAHGSGTDNVNKLYYREGDGSEWKLINDEAVSDRIETPVGFSQDNQQAYLRVEQTEGPDAILTMDIATGARKQVLRDDNTDPSRIIFKSVASAAGEGVASARVPVGAYFMDGEPRTEFFDGASGSARLQKSLEAAFQGQSVHVTSTTADARLALVQTFSDRNPGDFYVFDTQAKKAEHLISRRTWFDPDKMAEMRPVSFKARDGLPLHGYLTVPHGSSGKNLPLVLMPHGGPFWQMDQWGFDGDGQMLAEAGYAVLQVNFRGSSNHGRAFTQAGAREWGGKMQDDLTDATRWAIQQGVADPGLVCIFGASYGGYAALMGAAKEPGMYKCAAGYVGVYDLPMMHARGDIQSGRSGENYLREWVGDKDQLGAVSPNRLAGQIKVPVFLAAGGEDQRAPIEHSKMMERALIGAGVPVETLYYDSEGHGFYKDEHRREFYTRLLAFLSRNIGGATAKQAVTTTK